MPPFVAKENLVTTLWTELGSLAAPFFVGEEFVACLASSVSCCCWDLETGRGMDSVLRSRETGGWFVPSLILGSGRATRERLFCDLRSLVYGRVGSTAALDSPWLP